MQSCADFGRGRDHWTVVDRPDRSCIRRSARLRGHRGLGQIGLELPVFVVGATGRSGVLSLVEQILASHPGVFGAGERADVFPAVQAIEQGGSRDFPAEWDKQAVRREAAAEVERLRAVGGEANRVIDKLPGNVPWLGHLRIMLPNEHDLSCVSAGFREISDCIMLISIISGIRE